MTELQIVAGVIDCAGVLLSSIIQCRPETLLIECRIFEHRV